MQESYRQALGGIYPVPVLFFRKIVVCYEGICYTWHGPEI